MSAPLVSVCFFTASGSWGAAWFPDPAAPGLLALGRGAGVDTHTAQLSEAEPGQPWSLVTDAGELTVDPAGDPVDLSEGERAPVGVAQRCRVSGPSLLPAPADGVRAQRRPDADLGRYDSVREVCAWFDDAEATSLVALRPRRRRGHEEDQVGAAVLSGEPWGPAIDPRLSTTYGADGEPARVGLEVWSAQESEHPRRLAGEALPGRLQAAVPGWSLRVTPLRCHGRGEAGSGVYLLARRTPSP